MTFFPSFFGKERRFFRFEQCGRSKSSQHTLTSVSSIPLPCLHHGFSLCKHNSDNVGIAVCQGHGLSVGNSGVVVDPGRYIIIVPSSTETNNR